MTNYLSKYWPDDLPSFGECVKLNGQQVFFTPTGIERYRERFARAGFDIRRIETADQLGDAIEGSWHVELQCLIEFLETRPKGPDHDPIEAATLRAFHRGDAAEHQRLAEVLRRRNLLKLRVVRGK